MKIITVHAEISIRKPMSQVFRAILNPKPFFVSKTSGPLKAGSATHWEFPEMPGQGFDVKTKRVNRNKLIRFQWPRGEGKAMNTVEFKLKRFRSNTTTVFVSERGWPAQNKWRESSYMNCMGWTHMICSLKAYLEHRVNLRVGSFVHMKF